MAITEHELYAGYRGLTPVPDRRVEDQAIRVSLDVCIEARERDARWYRVRGEGFEQARLLNLRVLRELRHVRRLGLATVVDGRQPTGVGYHDWQGAA